MGWQDDQVVSQAPAQAPPTQAAQPAWAQDEVVTPASQQPPPVRPPPTEQPSLLQRAGKFWMDYGPASVIEPVANLASSMLTTPAAGLAGIATGGNADVVESVSNATYQPQGAGGRAITKAIQYPFQKLAQGADWVGDQFNNPAIIIPTPYGTVHGGPATATAVNTAIQAAPSIFLKGPKGLARAGEVAAEAPKPVPKAEPISPRQAIVDELIAKGLKVTPTQAGATGGSLAEGLSGHARLERSISLKNAKKVNELVGEDVGLKGSKEITQADLNRLYVEGNKPYAEIAKTGTRRTSKEYQQEIRSISDRTGGDSFTGDVPKDVKRLKQYYANIPSFKAGDAVNKIRQLRSDASKNIKALNAPEQNAKGHVQRAIAEALDNELTRHVESLGQPELAAKYKAARVQLAKVHTLEDALDGSNVSAAELAKAKDRGVPLTGNMDLIARAHTEFDRSFQNAAKVRDSSPFSVIDLGAGVAGASASPALTAAVLARPLTRAVLASDRYQRSLASGKKAPPKAHASKPALARPAAAAAPQRREQRK